MAKSDYGLPASNKATPRNISREEETIRWALAFGEITFAQFEKKYKQLQKEGKIWRKR